MARKKRQQGSNAVGLVILAALGLGLYWFGVMPGRDSAAGPTPVTRSVSTTATLQVRTAPAPLDVPRFVNVAELNVRHTPNTSGPLVMTLQRGTPLKVLGRKDGWLLIDINPTLEGWVSEALTTTASPEPNYRPPAALKATH